MDATPANRAGAHADRESVSEQRVLILIPLKRLDEAGRAPTSKKTPPTHAPTLPPPSCSERSTASPLGDPGQERDESFLAASPSCALPGHGIKAITPDEGQEAS